MFIVQIFERRGKRGLLVFQDVRNLKFLTKSGFVHASDLFSTLSLLWWCH